MLSVKDILQYQRFNGPLRVGFKRLAAWLFKKEFIYAMILCTELVVGVHIYLL